ncbi:MAG: EscU/YscU/HrcU family type III secretion system export apparatus switch protein [Myxococcales bacterium]|nr:EscU/YscU/HrcU family type III secretion system export apparatus switch protein [Myxococcales bacterium]
MAEDGNKPHPATPKRREENLKEGRFPKARDTTAVAGLLAAVGALVVFRDDISSACATSFVRCHGQLDAVMRGDADVVASMLPDALLAMVVPPAIATAVAGALAGGWQAGFRLYPEMMKLKFEALNPLPKLKDMVNPKKSGTELIIAMLRVGLVGWVCYKQLLADVPALLGLTGAPVASSISLIIDILLRLTLKVILTLAILAALDYAYNRWELEREMSMSDQEVKDEMKQQDLDPKLKGKLKERARQAARKRVLAAVASADAVVTNPTHISVALRYSAKDFAPTVVAKGHDDLALRIRAEARKHGIPILENRRLARALDAEVEMGHPIPGQHYVAVAKVLAFVFKLRGRQRRPDASKQRRKTRSPASVSG